MKTGVASLQRLCAKKLLADPAWLESGDPQLAKLPEPPLRLLLELAARGNAIRPLLGLVAKWPHATLNLRGIVMSPHFVHMVLNEVQKKLPHLQCLDIRGCTESVSLETSRPVLRLICGEEVLEDVRQMRVLDARGSSSKKSKRIRLVDESHTGPLVYADIAVQMGKHREILEVLESPAKRRRLLISKLVLWDFQTGEESSRLLGLLFQEPRVTSVLESIVMERCTIFPILWEHLGPPDSTPMLSSLGVKHSWLPRKLHWPTSLQTHLTELEVTGDTNPDFAHLLHLGELSHLTSFSFQSSFLSKERVILLCQQLNPTTLTSLNFSGNPLQRENNALANALGRFVNLRVLNLDQGNLGETDLQGLLPVLPVTLEELSIQGNIPEDHPNTRFLDSLIRCISSLPRLRILRADLPFPFPDLCEFLKKVLLVPNFERLQELGWFPSGIREMVASQPPIRDVLSIIKVQETRLL